MHRSGWAAWVALGLSACGFFKAERPATHPLEFVRKDADAVIELRDMGMLQQLRSTIAYQFRSAISPRELSRLQAELELMLGFDPTTAEGLRQVGLATQGPVAGEILADGSGAVWAIPVTDAKKFAPVFQTIMKTRVGVDDVKTETKEGVSITVLSVEFGPRVVVRAAHAAAKGHMLLGFGPQAADLVARAARLPKTDAVERSEAFQSMKKRLGDVYDVRMISSQGATALRSALRRLRRRAPRSLDGLVGGVTGAGWTLRTDLGTLKFDGLAQMNAEGMANANRVFKAPAGAPAGVLAVNLPTALAFAQAAGDPRALLDLLAPPGSSARAKVDDVTSTIGRDFGLDFMATVLPNMSGHAALAVGTDDLARAKFETLYGNPFATLWGAFAASMKDSKALAAMQDSFQKQLEAREAKVIARKIGESEVRDVAPLDANGAVGRPLFSTFAHRGAWGVSNRPSLAETVVKNPQRDELSGKPGVFIELRVDRLLAELRRFPRRELPPLTGPLVDKGFAYLALFNRATARIEKIDDGIQLQGELRFSLPIKSP